MGELISVLIPSFNQAKYIGETLESIRQQEYSPVECIVMDGGSTDDTAAVVGSFGDLVTVFRSEPDEGQSHALNKAIRAARGSILAWQNSDDLFLGRDTFAQAAAILGRGECDVAYGDTLVVDERSHPTYVRYGLPPRLDLFVNHRMFIANQSAFMRREVIERIGPVNTSLHYAMDVDFYLRMVLQDLRFRYVPRLWGAYRIHSGTKYGSDQRSRFAVELETVLAQHGVRRSVGGWMQGLAHMGAHAVRHGHLLYYLHKYVLRDLRGFLQRLEARQHDRHDPRVLEGS